MLTKVIIRNFKRFEAAEIDLGSPVVFVGPNNSGKTSAMQALTLWDVGLRRWMEKRAGEETPKRRSGVAINRRDLLAIPHPSARQLWRTLRVREVRRTPKGHATRNVRIDIAVEGQGATGLWKCGLEFNYANEESIYCRPLRQGKTRMPIPREAPGVNLVFLAPMSGLASIEPRIDPGAVNVRIGEGRTAEVLRNLCYRLYSEDRERWHLLVEQILQLFGARLQSPEFVAGRGEIAMKYIEEQTSYDLSMSGRGMQQTVLVLAYLYLNTGSVIMLDEPGANLEILRQKQIYRLVSDVASNTGSQIVAASHSAALLNEAVERDLVIAFAGQPHALDTGRDQVLKALTSIGFDQYCQAEQTGWVLYLEGPTDLAILRTFAQRSGNPRFIGALDRPFVKYVGNQPFQARQHFFALREALPSLRGIAILDRLYKRPDDAPGLDMFTWRRREIENYVCTRATLGTYAAASAQADEAGPLFATAERSRRTTAMNEAIAEIEGALKKLGKESPWSPDLKASDEFLKPLFADYSSRLGLPNTFSRKSFYELARYVPESEIPDEVWQKLEAIAATKEAADNNQADGK